MRRCGHLKAIQKIVFDAGTNILLTFDILKDKFKGVTKVGDDDVEKVAKEKPDLIIVLDQNKNIIFQSFSTLFD